MLGYEEYTLDLQDGSDLLEHLPNHRSTPRSDALDDENERRDPQE